MARPHIYIVEDELSIAELLEFNLQNEGYSTTSFTGGEVLFRELEADNFPPVSLFILDLMLPGMNGFEICDKLREHPEYASTLVMILTARGSEMDKVKGFETGADDYMTKPFGMREFLARVRALIRRQAKAYNNAISLLDDEEAEAIELPTPESEANDDEKLPVACYDLILDDAQHKVSKKGEIIDMTHREYELLKFLMLHRGNAYSRDDLLNYVWGYDYSGETRTVDVHIRQLRRKVEDNPSKPKMIETVRGFGYRFKDENRKEE